MYVYGVQFRDVTIFDTHLAELFIHSLLFSEFWITYISQLRAHATLDCTQRLEVSRSDISKHGSCVEDLASLGYFIGLHFHCPR